MIAFESPTGSGRLLIDLRERTEENDRGDVVSPNSNRVFRDIGEESGLNKDGSLEVLYPD